MATLEIRHHSHKVGVNVYHLEWCTKYRYNMFGKEKQHNLIIAALRNVAYRHGIIIRTLKVMSNHFHMLATFPHGMTDSKAMMLLKGGFAFLFFKHHEKSRLRLPQGHLFIDLI
jgi:putative transposase